MKKLVKLEFSLTPDDVKEAVCDYIRKFGEDISPENCPTNFPELNITLNQINGFVKKAPPEESVTPTKQFAAVPEEIEKDEDTDDSDLNGTMNSEPMKDVADRIASGQDPEGQKKTLAQIVCEAFMTLARQYVEKEEDGWYTFVPDEIERKTSIDIARIRNNTYTNPTAFEYLNWREKTFNPLEVKRFAYSKYGIPA